MFAEQEYSIDEVSRHYAEVKLIESRNKFMGFLRKRLNSPQDAEDVFQDFCVKVLRNHRSVKSGERLDAWLGTALRHTLIDHYRRQATRNRGAESYSIEVKVLTPEAEPEAQSACSCIAKAIHNLTPAQAELLQRLDLQDEPRDSVAAEMGVSLNALGVRIHRSRAALKKEIAEICSVCGEGGFMNCDCEHSRAHQPVGLPSRTASGIKM